MMMFYGFGMLAWLLFLIIAVTVTFAVYLFAVYAMTRLGRKFGVGGFWEFLVPIYNIMLLCDCAAISRWATLAVAAPAFFLLSGSPIGFVLSGGALSAAVSFAANVWLWGSIAQRLGKNFWLWGVLTPMFFWLPALALAFGESTPARAQPAGAAEDPFATRYIDLK